MLKLLMFEKDMRLGLIDFLCQQRHHPVKEEISI